jgi:phosphoglycolate phosphatase
VAVKRLVLFDLDGVLLDSKQNMEHAWSEVRRQTGVPATFSEYFRLIGRPFPDIMECLGLTSRAAELENCYREAAASRPCLLRFYNNVEAGLVFLREKGICLGIVTSKDSARTASIVGGLPVDFVCIETPRDQVRGKPAPDHLLLAMAGAQTDPADTIYVGDMQCDFEAAQRARIDYAHAEWGYGVKPTGALGFTRISDLVSFVCA